MHGTKRREFIYWMGMLAAGILLVGTWIAERRYELSTTPGLWIALGQVGLWGLIVYFNVQILRGKDEMSKRMQFEALAWAFPVSLFGILAAGIITRALEVTVFEVGDGLWALVVGYVAGNFITAWKYR